MATVLTATFADSVSATPGQKFSVLGGGITRLNPPALPATFTRLDLLLILEFAADEREATVSAILRPPSGDKLAELNAAIVRQEAANAEVLFIGVPLPPIRFDHAGRYSLEVVSGESRKEFGLNVEGPKTVLMPGIEQKRAN